VGTLNGASGIYIANGWVLTASHVGVNNFTLGSTTFTYDGNYLQLTNSDGTTTDMYLFHLSPPPPTPPVALASSTPAVNSVVDMIGYGHISGSTQQTIGSYTGFYWSAQGYKSWGNNHVNSGLSVINAGLGNITLFNTDFTAPGASQASDEAQAAAGDSGGGVFFHAAAGWQLAGMIDLEGTFSGQAASTACYGDLTYSADIATYRNQIISIIASTAPVLSITRSGTNVLACWFNTGVAYNLETANTLKNPNWTVVSGQFPNNGQTCVQLPATNSPSFFRLHKVGSGPS
jgi:hypothetical protein